MGRKKLYNREEFVSEEIDGFAKCLKCDRLIKSHMGNIKRHYESIHKKDFHSEERVQNGVDSIPVSTKKRKLQMVALKMDKQNFLKTIGKTVTEMHMAFSIYDNEDYQNLLQPWTDAYGIKFNSKSIGAHVKNMANLIRSEINSVINKKYICLKLDIASRMGNSVMGVNVQFINNEFEIVVYTIGMVELSERHFAGYLQEELLAILDRFGIQMSEVYSITIDNGANVIKTSTLLLGYSDDDDEQVYDDVSNEISKSMPVVHCAAHTLQLAAWDVIKTLNTEVTRCRNAVKIIRQKMKELKASPLPVLDNNTRWSSTFEMIKSLLNAKVWTESNNNFTADVDWEFVLAFVVSFKPIADATKLLQSKQLVMGDFYREWLVSETELEEMSKTNSVANSVLQALNRRKQLLVENNAFLAALYLDPRFCFRGSIYLNEDQKKSAISHLLTIFNKLKLSGEINGSFPNESRNYSNILAQSAVGLRYQKLEQKTTTNLTTLSDCSSVQESLDKLQYDEKLPFSTNILEYWKSKSYKNCIISKIAAVALAAPATQVSVKRAFSALPVVMSKYRYNLSSEHLENILLVKLNPSVIEKFQ